MSKAFLKHFLSLCILLLSVYGQLYAHAYQEFTRSSPIKNVSGIGVASNPTLLNANAFHSKYASADPEKSLKLEATDITEEDYAFDSSQRFFGHKNYFTAAFLALVLAYFFRHIKIGLLSCKHFSYSLSHKRYLLFEVFRI